MTWTPAAIVIGTEELTAPLQVTLSHRALFIPHDGRAKVPLFDREPVAVPLPSMSGLPFCTVAHIQATVALSYGVDPDSMTSDDRCHKVAWPRQVAMYLARELTRKSFTKIGELFGNRDHTTVIKALQAVERRMADDPLYRADVEALREALS